MESPAPEDNLGKIVTKKARVKLERRVAAARLQTEAAAKSETRRLAEALVRLNTITEEQIRLALVVKRICHGGPLRGAGIPQATHPRFGSFEREVIPA